MLHFTRPFQILRQAMHTLSLRMAQIVTEDCLTSDCSVSHSYKKACKHWLKEALCHSRAHLCAFTGI